MSLSIRARANILLLRYAARPRRSPPWSSRHAVLAVALFALIGGFLAQTARAETSNTLQHAVSAQQQLLQRRHALQQALQRKHNESTLMILGGRPGTGYFAMAHDMAAALGASDGLRLLAVDAAGGTDSLRDLLLLRGIDLALVPANALAYANATASFGPDLQERLTYVCELYGEEVHILVGRGIESFEDLRGKKIAVPPGDGNAEFTVSDLLRRLHVEAEVVKAAAPDAIDEVRSGAFAALVLMGGKPLRFIAGLPKDGSLRLLALPSNQALEDSYSPAGLRSEDYPALIPDGQTIDTVSVRAVLVTNNTAKWDESNLRVARFVPAFFGVLSELAGPQWHPKWSEVNLAASLAGWQRFAAAKEWLDRTREVQTASVERAFEEFLSAASPPGSPALSPRVRRQLFEEYLKWTRNSMGVPNQPARP